MRFSDVFRRYHGTLLAADERPRVVEGSWDREKVVLMSFPDEDEFRLWSESAEYQEISKDRESGADTVGLLVKGLAWARGPSGNSSTTDGRRHCSPSRSRLPRWASSCERRSPPAADTYRPVKTCCAPLLFHSTGCGC